MAAQGNSIKAILYALGANFAIFVAKLVVCIATFGFAFPNVQHD